MNRSQWIAIAAACLLLAIAHTWPLATAPGTLSRNDNGDAQLNEWILAWVAHQLPRVPAHLFEANIFYPSHDSLAFSEPLIVPALLGAPLAWIGGSPVLVFNVLVIAGFAMTALAGFVLVFRWTGDWAAAALAGSTFAFNTHTLTRLPHVQAVHVYGLALALLATERLLTRRHGRDALWLAAWMTVLAYTSGYLVVFAIVMVGIVVATRVMDWHQRAARVVGLLSIAGLLSAAAILPLYLPYERVAREQHMVRSLDIVGEYSATPTGYLAAAGRIHISTWSGRFFKDPVDSFFPGFVVIAFAGAAIWAAIRGRPEQRRRVLMLLAIALSGFILSLGTRTPIYGWLYHVLPPMQGLRAAARFGNLFLLGMSALAGLGLAAVRLRLGGRWTVAFAVAMIAVANVESYRAPFVYRRFDGIPALYTLLATAPGPVVLAEVPFYPRQGVFENAEYVLNSTAHWRPLMNGYSGYTPESYGKYADAFWYFPREHAIQAMRQAGVTHVMLHPSRFGRDADDVVRQIGMRTDFELLAVGRGGLRLYRLH